MGRLFRGLNLRVGENDLDEAFSPDTSNADFYKGRLGSCGPRKGVTFVNPQPFSARLTSIVPYQPIGYDPLWVVANADGEVEVVDAPFSTAGFPTLPSSSSWFAVGPNSLDGGNMSAQLDYPDLSYETTDDSFSIDLTAKRYAKFGLTLWSRTSATATMNVRIHAGYVIDGRSTYLESFDAVVVGNMKWESFGGTYGGVGVELPSVGTATAGCAKVEILDTAWAAGGTAGDFLKAQLTA